MNYKIPITQTEFEKVSAQNNFTDEERKKRKKYVEDKIAEFQQSKGDPIEQFVKGEFQSKYLKENATSDEELEKRVTDKVLQNKENTAMDLKKQNNDKKVAIESEKQSEYENLQNDKQKINQTYETAKENANNQAIKRGIGRSSIIFNMLKDYDLGKIKSIESRENTFRETSEKLNDEIKKLDESLSTALKKLDMESAIEINEKLDKLKSERDEYNKEVIKYNNTVNQNLAEYKRQLLNSSAGDKIIKDATEKANNDKKDIAYGIINYYKTLTPEEALNDFYTSNYEEILDPKHLNLIYGYLNQLNASSK